MTSATPVKFRYKNYEGKTRIREAVIKRIWFGETKWHPEPQWFIRALCVEHNADRDFALRDCNFAWTEIADRSMPVDQMTDEELEQFTLREVKGPR